MKRNRTVWIWVWMEIPSHASNVFEFEDSIGLGSPAETNTLR